MEYTFMKFTVAVFAACTLIAVRASAGEPHRELGPHQHGHGTLNIAIESGRVSMDLDVPGMDVVGFEHAPNSAEQKAAAQKAEDTLKQPLALFKVPAAAACKVADAKVAIEQEHGDNHHAEADNSKAVSEAAEHADDEHEGHNDYNVTYVLECSNPSALSSIEFDYFKAFAGAKALTVNVVSEKAQNTFEVTREKPVADLGGMM
jgi:hypothetical protein